jgi:hypothetical protein
MDPYRAAITRRLRELASYMRWHEAHPWVSFSDIRGEHAAELRYLQRLVASVEAREEAPDFGLQEFTRGASPKTQVEDRMTEGEAREAWGK